MHRHTQPAPSLNANTHPFAPTRRWWPWLTALLCAMGLVGCRLAPLEGATASHALPEAQAQLTRLGQSVQQMRGAQDAALSGIHVLSDAHDAFAARALLARAAERTLDVQYYIWRHDKTGLMLLGELLDAADRGVRVRLLLDDLGTSGMDAELHALNSHPHIEVRLFNPFALRTPKFLCFVTDFARANRRMHNKSFTADNAATIVGGRNVGNEYFGATDGVLFADLDVLALGASAHATSNDFDRYWNSGAAYPVDRLISGPHDPQQTPLRAALQTLRSSDASRDFKQAVAQTPFLQQLLAAQLPVQWVPARLVSDEPSKVWGHAEDEDLIVEQLTQALGTPRAQLDLVSPYFVPTQAGVDVLAQLQRNGVQVRVVTNALEATDVAVVHAGYAKYRQQLLRAGVQLYEMRLRTPSATAHPGEQPKPDALGALQQWGSSGSSLHAKTFAVDGQRLFVGSFNFDPRSSALNTELGLVMDSPQLTQYVADMFTTQIPTAAYRVELNAEGQLRWHTLNPDGAVTYEREPYSSLWLRMGLTLLGWLPIEWLL